MTSQFFCCKLTTNASNSPQTPQTHHKRLKLTTNASNSPQTPQTHHKRLKLTTNATNSPQTAKKPHHTHHKSFNASTNQYETIMKPHPNKILSPQPSPNLFKSNANSLLFTSYPKQSKSFKSTLHCDISIKLHPNNHLSQIS
jgi:hypothetical protein